MRRELRLLEKQARRLAAAADAATGPRHLSRDALEAQAAAPIARIGEEGAARDLGGVARAARALARLARVGRALEAETPAARARPLVGACGLRGAAVDACVKHRQTVVRLADAVRHDGRVLLGSG